MLRRDFAKFDEHRYQKFRNFLLGVPEEETEGAGLHATYFENIYKQLREVAAFPADKSPMEALQAATRLDAAEIAETQDSEDRARQQGAVKMAAEARARWVCVQRVAQTVQPDLFPSAKPEIPRSRASMGLELSSQLGSDGDPAEPISPRYVKLSKISPRASANGRRNTIQQKRSSLQLSLAQASSKEAGQSARESFKRQLSSNESKDSRPRSHDRSTTSKESKAEKRASVNRAATETGLDRPSSPSSQHDRRPTSKESKADKRASVNRASTETGLDRQSSPSSQDNTGSPKDARRNSHKRGSLRESPLSSIEKRDLTKDSRPKSQEKRWPPQDTRDKRGSPKVERPNSQGKRASPKADRRKSQDKAHIQETGEDPK